MRKMFSLALAILIVLSITACGSSESTTASTAATSALRSFEERKPDVEETAPTSQPQILEDNLFLKVSSITFSLVGESEDIKLYP